MKHSRDHVILHNILTFLSSSSLYMSANPVDNLHPRIN